MKKNSLVNFEIIDYLTIILYLLVWTFISICHIYSYFEIDTINYLIQLTLFLVPILLFTGYFRRLRVLKVYLTWLGLSIIQVVILFPFSDEEGFQHATGSYFDLKYNLSVMLIMLFVFRLTYFWFFKQELLIVTKYTNLYEREANYFDYFFTIFGLLVLGLICPIVFLKLDFF